MCNVYTCSDRISHGNGRWDNDGWASCAAAAVGIGWLKLSHNLRGFVCSPCEWPTMSFVVVVLNSTCLVHTAIWPIFINFLLFFSSSPYSDPNLIIVIIVVLSNCPSTVKAKPLGDSSSRQGTGMARADRNQMNNIGKETVKTLEVAFNLMKHHLPIYVSWKNLLWWINQRWRPPISSFVWRSRSCGGE